MRPHESIQESKRDISPILVTIMMVVVGTASAFATFTLTDEPLEQLLIENVEFTSSNVNHPNGYIEVALRNTGTVDVSIQKVYVDGSELSDQTGAARTEAEARAIVEESLSNLPYTLDKQTTSWFVIKTPSDNPVEKSRTYHLKFVTVKGMAVEGYFTSPAE